jgi:O-antigen/teichoic acid export membrane protein
MLLVVAVVTLMGGFRSISLTLYEKDMKQKELVIVELGSQLFGTICMIMIAFLTRSVWALLAGHVIIALAKLVASYFYLKDTRNWFALEPKAVKEIIQFGKWIFLSSLFGLVATQADVMIMGLYLSMEQLGFYSIAAIFARAIAMLIGQISTKVLHPYFRRVIEEDNYIPKLQGIRNKLNLVSVGVCMFFAIFGDLIVHMLYEERYRDAGWMLQFLALGKIGQCMSGTLRPLLFAKGDSYSSMVHQVFVTIVLIIGMVAGFNVFGPVGLIIAYSFVPMLCHPLLVVQARKHGFYCARSDIGLIVAGLGIVVVDWIIIGSPAAYQALMMLDGNYNLSQ